MFKKLKEKIGQESSPNAKTKSAEFKTPADDSLTSPPKLAGNSIPSVHTTGAVSGDSEAHDVIVTSNSTDLVSDSTNVPDSDSVPGKTSLLADRSNDDATPSDVIVGNNIMGLMDGSIDEKDDNGASLLTLNEATPRRKNLAATVLKYGEEISSKNRIIADLEMQVSVLIEGGGDHTHTERINQELRDKLKEREINEIKLEAKIKRYLEQIDELEKSAKTLEINGADSKTLIADLEVKLSAKQNEVLQLTNQLASCEEHTNNLDREIVNFRNQVQHLHRDIEEKDSLIVELTNKQVMDTSTHSPNLPVSRDEGEMSQLKTKLGRVHSHSKQLEKQLEDKNLELSNLLRENREMKSSLENSKQQALDELLSVSQEESVLRSELSAHVQKLTTLEAQHKTQSRLLAEKQKDMSKMEVALDRQLQNSREEKERITSEYCKQISELKHTCESLTLSLATETQTAVKVKEQLDSLREEALDKQLDDEKQLSDLHEQLSNLRGELRQLERSKRKEVDELNNDLSAKDAMVSKLQEDMSSTASESESKLDQLHHQIEQLKLDISQLSAANEKLTHTLTDTQSRLDTVSSEADDLYLRNADLSSQLEKCKIELKLAITNHQQEVASLQQKLLVNEESEGTAKQRHEALQEKITLLEGVVDKSQTQQRELDERDSEIQSLKEQLVEQEKTISDRNKSLKIHHQTINDLKKTIKRELRGLNEDTPQRGLSGGTLQRGLSESHPARSQELMERVRSSPALADLDRYDSPIEDNVPLPTTPTTVRLQATAANNATTTGLAQQYRHEVNGFCGHKDVNFEYLKNVVFSFLVSKDSESLHLVKALAVLLEFTPAEERLLKDTLEWKMSWWPSAKKPSKKLRK